MAVAWPSALPIKEQRLQNVHPGQVVQFFGQVVNTQEPQWEITTTFYEDDRDALATFLDSLGGALEDTLMPLHQDTSITGGNKTQTITDISLNDAQSQVKLTTNQPSIATFGIAAGQYWQVGSASEKSLYKIVRVNGADAFFVPGRLPVQGTNTMVLATNVRVRLAEPAESLWGNYDALTNRYSSVTVNWREA